MPHVRLISTVALAAVGFSAAAQELTPSPSNTVYDFFFSGPATVSLNGAPGVTGTATLSGSGYGLSSAGSGPGFIAETVPLNSLSFFGPGSIGGAIAPPGVFRQQNVDPVRFPMSGGSSMSIGGVTLTGSFNLHDVFGFTRNAGVSCIDCASTFTTDRGDVISFQFASGPVITALERAAATGVLPVPEPATLLLLSGGLGLLSLARVGRRFAQQG